MSNPKPIHKLRRSCACVSSENLHVLKVDCDEDGGGGNDAADCLRYLVATKSRTVAQRELRGL